MSGKCVQNVPSLSICENCFDQDPSLGPVVTLSISRHNHRFTVLAAAVVASTASTAAGASAASAEGAALTSSSSRAMSFLTQSIIVCTSCTSVNPIYCLFEMFHLLSTAALCPPDDSCGCSSKPAQITSSLCTSLLSSGSQSSLRATAQTGAEVGRAGQRNSSWGTPSAACPCPRPPF